MTHGGFLKRLADAGWEPVKLGTILAPIDPFRDIHEQALICVRYVTPETWGLINEEQLAQAARDILAALGRK